MRSILIKLTHKSSSQLHKLQFNLAYFIINISQHPLMNIEPPGDGEGSMARNNDPGTILCNNYLCHTASLRVGYMEMAFLFTMATLRSSADRKLGLSVWLYYESYFTMNPNYYMNRYNFQLITQILNRK